jgi:hypothetical protein
VSKVGLYSIKASSHIKSIHFDCDHNEKHSRRCLAVCSIRFTSGGLLGEATEAGPHPHLSMNLNKNLILRISILQICFYIIIIL